MVGTAQPVESAFGVGKRTARAVIAQRPRVYDRYLVSDRLFGHLSYLLALRIAQ